MTTTKSYLAGLGMTGIVIGSVLVLLALGTGLVGFDGAPDGARGGAPLERVVVGDRGGSAGAEAGRTEPEGTPAAGLRPARPPVVSGAEAAVPRGAATGSGGGRRHAAHGHGGAQVRPSDILGGGAAVRRPRGGGGAATGDHPRDRSGAAPGRAGGGAFGLPKIQPAPRLVDHAAGGAAWSTGRAGGLPPGSLP